MIIIILTIDTLLLYLNSYICLYRKKVYNQY